MAVKKARACVLRGGEGAPAQQSKAKGALLGLGIGAISTRFEMYVD